MLTVLIFQAGPALSLPNVDRTGDPTDLSPAEMVGLAFRSAAIFHPGCRRILLTDETSQFPNLDRAVEIIRREMDATRLMLERKVSQLGFLQQHSAGISDVLMLDADMLVNSRLSGLFRGGMHLGLTYRDKPGMPVNGGVIAVSRTGSRAAADFLQRAITLMERNAYCDLGQYRDQHALIEILGMDRFRHRASDMLEVEGIGRVALWPCETHNYTPPNEDGSVFFRDRCWKIIHFKGPRKRLMRRYWDLHYAALEPAAAHGGWWRGLLRRASG